MHLGHAGMEAREGRERLLDQPVDLGVGPRRLEVGERREGVDDVAERGELYDQDAHGASVERSSSSTTPMEPRRRASFARSPTAPVAT